MASRVNQNDIFERSEGDAWFMRNADYLSEVKHSDLPLSYCIELAKVTPLERVIELGCSNGYRLDAIRSVLGVACEGVDISSAAISDGRQRFPGINLSQADLIATKIATPADVVIVNFVLHWVDRQLLSATVAEIDRLVSENGCLILGDFLPDYPCKTHYHHRDDVALYTYKQDYTKLFLSLGTYQLLDSKSYHHDDPALGGYHAKHNTRANCSVLKKKLDGYVSS